MLLFIKMVYDNRVKFYQFQYISCYSLSSDPRAKLKPEHCFNTSHVTLYPRIISTYIFHSSFQYISCYSLSSIHLSTTLISEVSIHLMLLFINNRNIMECKEICFNTSHVTLYRTWKNSKGGSLQSFNTSHVTLYHVLSSHVLLRKGFQYISCYSLSIP